MLTEAKSKSGLCSGRTFADSPEIDGTVYFTGDAEPGTFIDVHITSVEDGELYGVQEGL